MISGLRSGIALFVVVSCVGCSTAYQHKSFTGGFDDRMIDDNTAYVTFRGNGFTSQETVEQYVLLRCAEVTTTHGYDYFIVGGSAEPSNVGNTNVFGAKVNNKYLASATIKMFKGKKPTDSLNAYDAGQIEKNLYTKDDGNTF
jgi:hypothetical protein